MKIINKKIAAKKSSAVWMRRQLADPYVIRAKAEGFRARSVFKLSEIDEKFHIFRNGQIVVDLGAAPGSWSEYVRKNFPNSKIIAMDLLPIKRIAGVEFFQGDFTSNEARAWLAEKIGGRPVDVVLSDMAPNTTGHQKTDHIRQAALMEYAFEFARENLKQGGAFIAKSFTGGASPAIFSEIKKHFRAVRHVKPAASRKDSVEMFVCAVGKVQSTK